MNYENKKTLIISIAMILLLGFLSYRNFVNLEIPQIPSQIMEIPIIEMPPIGEALPPEMTDLLREPGSEEEKEEGLAEWTYLSYTIPQVMNFKYPSHWLTAPPETAVEYKEMMDVLFFAHAPDALSPAIMVVSRIKINSFTEGLEFLKETFERDNIGMKVLEKQETERGLFFSARYDHNGRPMISREKILIANNNFYLFSIIVSEGHLAVLSPQIEYLINSIQIIK